MRRPPLSLIRRSVSSGGDSHYFIPSKKLLWCSVATWGDRRWPSTHAVHDRDMWGTLRTSIINPLRRTLSLEQTSSPICTQVGLSYSASVTLYMGRKSSMSPSIWGIHSGRLRVVHGKHGSYNGSKRL